MTEPMAAIHQGALAGRLKASSRPVTTALRSLMVLFWCAILSYTSSESTAKATATIIRASAGAPKNQTAASAVGIRAITTSPISLRVDTPSRRKGDEDTTSFVCISMGSFLRGGFLAPLCDDALGHAAALGQIALGGAREGAGAALDAVECIELFGGLK